MRGHPATLTSLLLILAACLDKGQTPTATPMVDAPVDATPAGRRTISVGQSVTGTITGIEPECRFTNVDGGWGGVCHAFAITVPTDGVLEITARWNAAFLVLFLKTSGGAQIDMGCCSSPAATFQAPVEAGLTYTIELAYGGRPAGYPTIEPVSYTLQTRLLSTEDQPPAGVRVILFGDETRTQRLSSGRVEVVLPILIPSPPQECS